MPMCARSGTGAAGGFGMGITVATPATSPHAGARTPTAATIAAGRGASECAQATFDPGRHQSNIARFTSEGSMWRRLEHRPYVAAESVGLV